MSRRSKERYKTRINSQLPLKLDEPVQQAAEKDLNPDWTHECEVCGQTPIVPFTGLCGPCTFGEANTAGGNW